MTCRGDILDVYYIGRLINEVLWLRIIDEIVVIGLNYQEYTLGVNPPSMTSLYYKGIFKYSPRNYKVGFICQVIISSLIICI